MYRPVRPSLPQRIYLMMAILDGQLYVPAFDTNTVFRLTINSSDNLTLKDSFAADSPVAVTFSPDGLEMFTSGHLNSDIIDRFQYDAPTDSWNATTKVTTSSSLGQILAVP